MRRAMLLICLAPWLARADTVYFCKAYSGGMFWSAAPCSQKQATTDRMVSVPDNLSWSQQVALAEAARSEGEAISNPYPAVVTPLAQTARHQECEYILASIAKLDAQIARRRSGQVHDRNVEQKDRLEERRKRLQC